MKEYTVVHFQAEESLFKSHNYPYCAEHKKEHQDFVDKVISLENKLKEGKIIISFEITTFLKEWLIKHIKGTDMKYTKFLVDKGVR